MQILVNQAIANQVPDQSDCQYYLQIPQKEAVEYDN
jgi:hypothetical protein